MIIESALWMFAQWCDVENKTLTHESKVDCVYFIKKCSYKGPGIITGDESLLKSCISQGQKLLLKKNTPKEGE
jgi:hypothetical protein